MAAHKENKEGPRIMPISGRHVKDNKQKFNLDKDTFKSKAVNIWGSCNFVLSPLSSLTLNRPAQFTGWCLVISSNLLFSEHLCNFRCCTITV